MSSPGSVLTPRLEVALPARSEREPVVLYRPGYFPPTRPLAAASKAGDGSADHGHEFKTVYCAHDGYARKILIGCGRRSCKICRKRWYGQHFEALHALVSGWSHPRFITLTLKNIPDEEFAAAGKDHVAFARSCFAKLRRKLPRIEGGFYAVEVTNHGHGFHLHLHVVYDGGYIEEQVLKAAWVVVTHGSFIVDIKDVYDARGAVNYLLKDLLKVPKIRPEDVDVFDRVFERSHMIQPFGPHGKTKYKVVRVPCKCPLCGGTVWMSIEPLFDPEYKRMFGSVRGGLSPPFSESCAAA